MPPFNSPLWTLTDRTTVRVLMPRNQQERMRTRCFRGPGHILAGNLCFWQSGLSFLRDGEVQEHLCRLFLKALEEESGPGVFSNTFTCHDFVGWSSAIPCRTYTGQSLETKPLGKRGKGVFITDRDFLAPLTKKITVIYSITESESGITILIQSVYPGSDVGELEGNLTEREGVYFFDFEHRGQPLPKPA